LDKKLLQLVQADDTNAKELFAQEVQAVFEEHSEQPGKKDEHVPQLCPLSA
jgi:hypothetical protein